MLSRLTALVLISSAAFAQTPVSKLWEEKTLARLRAYDSALDGVLGVAAIDLTDGRVIDYHGGSQFPTASSIKIAVMIRLFRDERAGRFHFTDEVTVQPIGAIDDSEGPLHARLKNGPVKMTVREAMEAMMRWSDNAAANRCIDLVGMERVNEGIRELGLRDTHLRRKMMDLAAAREGRENVSTPLELARMLEAIYRGRAADAESCREMLELMKTVHAPFMRPAIPAGIELAAKPGSLDGVKCEAGAVFLKGRPFVMTVMTTYLDDGKVNPVAGAAKIVFEYFEKVAAGNEWGRRLE